MFCLMAFVLIGTSSYYIFNPKNSLELYQSVRFSDDFEDVQRLMLEGFESNFKQGDYDFIAS